VARNLSADDSGLMKVAADVEEAHDGQAEKWRLEAAGEEGSWSPEEAGHIEEPAWLGWRAVAQMDDRQRLVGKLFDQETPSKPEFWDLADLKLSDMEYFEKKRQSRGVNRFRARG
jgi:hypothetical protein